LLRKRHNSKNYPFKLKMRNPILFGTALAVVTGTAINPGLSIQLQDGTVYFTHTPSLVYSGTTYNSVRVPNPTYYFTIDVPKDAGEPLEKVTINQHQGIENIDFDLRKTSVFVGTKSHEQEKLSLKDVTRDKKTHTVTLTFDPPVTTVGSITIALQPYQNPWSSGVYLFGVTAFPAGAKSYGQFLGYGRLQFYSNGHYRAISF
jgi:hypothetical protein